MAGGGTAFVKAQRIQGFSTILTSAFCEWFLIFLLLVNAVLSYLLTKFASFCCLQSPCILCSRIDHVQPGQKLDFYQNLLCSNHRSEISSLISCHIHDKMSDGHGMCDDCLLSFTTKNKSPPKTHRWLVGKLELVLGGCFQSSLLSRDLFTGSTSTCSRPCTCCGKLGKSGQKAQTPLQLESSGSAVLESDIPLPHVSGQSRLNHHDNLIRDQSSGSVTCHCIAKSSFDPLFDVGYSELKLTSDSESEFPVSDDDVGSLIHESIVSSNKPIAQFTSVVPRKRLLSDSNPAKPNSIFPETVPLLLYPCVEPNNSKHHDVKFPSSDSINDFCLDEINWQQANQKPSSSELPQLISLQEASPSPHVVDISNGESGESKINSCLSRNSLPATLSELMTSDGTRPLVGALPKKYADDTRASDIGLVSKKREEGLRKIATRAGATIETDPLINNSDLISPRQDNLSNMNELPVTTKERKIPGFVIEHPTPKEVKRVNEEPKLSSSRNSSPRVSNMSSVVVPINHVPPPVIQADTASSNGTEELQKSASVESALESLDASSITEIEGESIVDRLKRQIEYDKKCMNALYKELEEERNAAEIAANESMAMITRLQEEKAVLHMDALQYLRMMEEQAEYDGEELEKANDLLAEKEKELQDLEAELEFYRLNLTDEPTGENMHEESCAWKGENITLQNASLPHITKNVNIPFNSKIAEASKVSDESGASHTSSLEFEKEKMYISECLKSLEKKLRQISCNGISSTMPNGRPEKFEDRKSDHQGPSNGEGPHLDGQKKDTDWSMQKDFITSNGSLTDQDSHSTSFRQKNSMHIKEVDLVALENEISVLNDRLEALETDHGLLEHIVNVLGNEDDGIQFIREIAYQLHELRKIGTRQRW